MVVNEIIDTNEAHSRFRAKERYGITLSSREYKRLCKAVMNPNKTYKGIVVESLGRMSNLKSVKKILYKNVVFYAIYNMRYHCIQTFLPREYDFLKMKMYAVSHNRRIDF